MLQDKVILHKNSARKGSVLNCIKVWRGDKGEYFLRAPDPFFAPTICSPATCHLQSSFISIMRLHSELGM